MSSSIDSSGLLILGVDMDNHNFDLFWDMLIGAGLIGGAFSCLMFMLGIKIGEMRSRRIVYREYEETGVKLIPSQRL